MRDSHRRGLSVLAVVVTALLLAACALSLYARTQIADADAFAHRAEAALDDRDVRAVIGDRVVGGLSRSVAPEALVVRPLLATAVAGLAGTPPFRRYFERVVRDRHAALMNGERSFGIRLLAGGGLLLDSLRSISPRLADAIPPGLTLPLVALNPTDVERRAAGWISTLAGWLWPLVALSVAGLAACAWLARGRRRALAHAGIAVAGAGAIVAALVAGMGAFVVAHLAHAADLDDEVERHALEALWSALFGDLRDAGLLAVVGGLAVAVLASGARAAEGAAWLGRRLAELARSEGPAARRARAALLVSVGVALVLAPGTTLRVVTVVAGALLVLAGAAQLAPRAADGTPSERGVLAPGVVGAAPPPAERFPLALAASVAGVALLTLAAIALVLPAPGGAPAAAPAPAGACNGSRALCDRRLNEVVFPSTHNSFSAADEPGWYFANQTRGMARQLRDGIRGFLIDVHYGVPDRQRGIVRTDLAYEGSSRNKVVRELSPEALVTAERLAGRLGARPEGERRVYLCHTLCELGSEPLDRELRVFRDFLGANPREVIVLFVEPYVPPEEIEREFRDAGLLRYAAELDRDAPLPTLRELIRSGRRLIVFAEEDGGTLPWYLDGFSFVQDTPLGATRASEFSCALFRGSPDSPLLLLNHWIDTFPPSPRRNGRVGDAVLEGRARRCEREREMVANLPAVDFYERSGVVRIAERLNAR